MVKLILIGLLLSPNLCALELQDLSIEAISAMGTSRSVYLPEGEIRTGEINLKLTMKQDILYSINTIYSTIGETQFAHVGLESEFGASYNDIDLFINHRSDHALDNTYTIKYPNINGIGIRIKLK